MALSEDLRERVVKAVIDEGLSRMEYTDPGASYYEDRYRARVLANLRRRAKSLGYALRTRCPRQDSFSGRPRMPRSSNARTS